MRLSICIPTHDGRCGTLREALDSVLPQITPELRPQVEICISDNASRDGTEALAAQLCQDHPGLVRYRRNSTNLGFLGNLLGVMDLASGDFCWLLSSDDQIAEGGLRRVLWALEEDPALTGLTVLAESFDRTLSPASVQHNDPSLLPDQPERPHLYADADAVFQNCGIFQGCFSAQVVSRPRWQAALAELGQDRLAENLHFPHLYLIGRMVQKHPRWRWLPELAVRTRRDNDALTADMAHNQFRYRLETMRDLSLAWAALLGRRSARYRDLMGRVHAEQWNGRSLLALKVRTRCRPADEWAVLTGYTRHLGFLPEYWRRTFPVALLPSALLRLGFRLKAAVRALAGRAQGGRPVRGHV